MSRQESLTPALERHVAVLDCRHRIRSSEPLPGGEAVPCLDCARADPMVGRAYVVRVVRDSCAAACVTRRRWGR